MIMIMHLVQVVFLELCSFRKSILMGQIRKVLSVKSYIYSHSTKDVSNFALQAPTIREMVDMWRNNMTASFILYEWYICKLVYMVQY